MNETLFTCPVCRVQYPVPVGQKAICPLCSARRHVEELRRALQISQARLSHTEDQYEKMRRHVDLNMAIREALDLADARDVEFIHFVVSSHVNDKSSLQLRVTRTPGKKGEGNGFLVDLRGRSTGHVCTSIGGVAVASLYAEAAMLMGSSSALTLLARAVAQRGELLPSE